MADEKTVVEKRFTHCEICESRLVLPYGPEESHILLVGEFPGIEEINQGVPFVGTTGSILMNELARCGIAIQMCRRTNLWMHRFDPKMYAEEGHLEWHLARLNEAAAYAKDILMMGSELSKLFLKRSISDVSGLTFPIYYLPGKRVTFSINPAAAIHGSIGEVRLAIEKFAARCQESQPEE